MQKPPDDILDWNLYFYEYRDAAFRNDLRAAGTALGVPSNSDAFLDFRAWLIAQGKETYMAAMGNPDTLAEQPTIGADMKFEELANCAVDAYAELLSAAPEKEACRLYDKLDHHQLGDQALAELRGELPQRQDMETAAYMRSPISSTTAVSSVSELTGMVLLFCSVWRSGTMACSSTAGTPNMPLMNSDRKNWRSGSWVTLGTTTGTEASPTIWTPATNF